MFGHGPISNHTSEVGLLSLMALGIIILLGLAIVKGVVGGPDAHSFDVAAFLLVLQRIIEAVQKRWEQRSQDAAAMALATSAPAIPAPADGVPAGTPADPIHTFEENPQAKGGGNV